MRRHGDERKNAGKKFAPSPSLLVLFFSVGIFCFPAGCNKTDSGDYRPFSTVQSGNVEILSDQNDPDSQNDTPADGTATRTAANASTAKTQLTGSDSAETVSANLDATFSIAETPERDPVPNTKPAESQPAFLEPVLAQKPARSEQREIKILIPEKKFRVVGPEKAIRVSYDDINLLKVINMEPVTPDAPKHMPKWLKNLNGKRIRIRGFMSPTFEQTGLRMFLLGRDNQACCFPGRAKIYDLFPVRLREGKTTEFIDNRPFDVVGIFSIKPEMEGGRWYRLYQLDDAVVIEK